jgi:hypothetical protein
MYNYIGGQDWISLTRDLPLTETRKCKLILKNGSVYLTEESNCLFGPQPQGAEPATTQAGG